MKKENGFKLYLREQNLLQSSNLEAIAEAKKTYWKEYKRAWRQAQRHKEKEITISYTPSELKIISEAAALHHISRTKFIKEAAFSYLDRRYLTPDPKAVNHIRQLLAMSNNMLLEISEKETISRVTSFALLEHMTKLEKEILTQLINPTLIS